MSSSQGQLAGKVYFEEGIPGFLHLHFFELVQQDSDTPFFVLHSLEEEHISFWVVDPFSFFKTYEFDLQDQVKERLRIEEGTPIAVVNIVTNRPDEVTVNLRAPIIINLQNGMAKQVILNDDNYQVRHVLFKKQTKAVSE